MTQLQAKICPYAIRTVIAAPMDSSRIRTVCDSVIRTIGQRMRESLASERSGSSALNVSLKGPADFVTEVDMWAEAQIAAAVQQHFPDHLLIGEETSDALLAATPGKSLNELAASGITWVVDPIDGTANFVSGSPLSVVSIGILKDGEPALGFVYDPARDEMFFAEKGKGAFLNDSPIQVSENSAIENAFVATGFPHDRRKNFQNYRNSHEALLSTVGKVRMLGATALEMAWVACGRFDGFVEHGPKSWDVAGAAILITEAGGQVSDFTKPRDASYSVFANSVLASNGRIHSELFTLCQV